MKKGCVSSRTGLLWLALISLLSICLGTSVNAQPGADALPSANDAFLASKALDTLNTAKTAKAKAGTEANKKTRVLNFFRANYIALQCGPSDNKIGGCNQKEYEEANWTRLKDKSGVDYVFTPNINDDDSIVEIIPATKLDGLTWGDHGTVSKIVARYTYHGTMEWTCHYSGSNRTSIAVTARNSQYDPVTNTQGEGSIVLSCDNLPFNALTRYRWIEFRRR